MSWRDRLQCAGPSGGDRSDTSPTSVTSVTTSTNAQHVSSVIEQAALNVPISSKAPRFCEPDQPDEGESTKALHEIAGLLAGAYRRQQEIRRVPADRFGADREDKLALLRKPSVHGVVP